VLALALVAARAGSSSAAGSGWGSQASKVCRTWEAKAEAALANKPLRTAKQVYAFFLKARPFEAGMIRALEAIRLPRPAGAARALRLAHQDLAELDLAIGVYRKGDQPGFLRAANVYVADRRASNALVAAGARDCT
jgi:hypothetical protein